MDPGILLSITVEVDLIVKFPKLTQAQTLTHLPTCLGHGMYSLPTY